MVTDNTGNSAPLESSPNTKDNTAENNKDTTLQGFLQADSDNPTENGLLQFMKNTQAPIIVLLAVGLE